jgi:hypothetical protein
LTIKIGDIINNINSRDITNGLIRMENYLQTSGKKYDVSIEFTNLENSEIKIDFTTIRGTIEVDIPRIILGKKLILGNKIVPVSKDVPFELNISSTDSLSSFYNISLEDAKSDKEFTNQLMGIKIKVLNKADYQDWVELLVNNIKLSNSIDIGLRTELTKLSSIYVKEAISGNPIKTYNTYLLNNLDYSGLTIKIGDIIDNVNSLEITNGLTRMEGYLQTSGKSYKVSIEFINFESSKIGMDFRTFVGIINVD